MNRERPAAKDIAMSQTGNAQSSSRKQNAAPIPKTHVKCRNAQYGRCTVQRFPVPDDKVHWSTPWDAYAPVYHVDVSVTGPNGQRPVWSDLEEYFDKKPLPSGEVAPKWNDRDGKVNRMSHMGKYEVDAHGVPRNPVGRTGMTGRGLLGRWGPNHAADPIVTRWKRDAAGNVLKHQDGRPILQFVAIKRRDTGEWAIPGGMVDPGERVSITLKREFAEETMNMLEKSDDQRKSIQKMVSDTFDRAVEVYRGYVDDPRNTDNSWMETVAVNAHDELGDSVGLFKLHAGDDATGVRWADLDSSMQLYASHTEFLCKVAKTRKAHW